MVKRKPSSSCEVSKLTTRKFLDSRSGIELASQSRYPIVVSERGWIRISFNSNRCVQQHLQTWFAPHPHQSHPVPIRDSLIGMTHFRNIWIFPWLEPRQFSPTTCKAFSAHWLSPYLITKMNAGLLAIGQWKHRMAFSHGLCRQRVLYIHWLLWASEVYRALSPLVLKPLQLPMCIASKSSFGTLLTSFLTAWAITLIVCHRWIHQGNSMSCGLPE